MVLLPPCAPTQCGKDLRDSLKKPSPNYPYGYKMTKPRVVPAFTIQAMQKNTRCGEKRHSALGGVSLSHAQGRIKVTAHWNHPASPRVGINCWSTDERRVDAWGLFNVEPPSKCGVYDPQPCRPTLFRKCYKRGEFPVTIEFSNSGKRLAWKVPIEKLDFHHYLPMFFDGIAEAEYPYTYIVEQGINDLCHKGSYKVLATVPQLIIPIKNALSTRRPNVICHTLKCIQMIVTGCDKVGEALVPYYRQILPVLNLFKDKNRNIGADIDHTTTRRENVGDLIEETLQILERYGGPDAFINIKYMIPTYESCVQN